MGEEAREEGGGEGAAGMLSADCLVADLTGCARTSNLSDGSSASRPARRCIYVYGPVYIIRACVMYMVRELKSKRTTATRMSLNHTSRL